MSYLNTLLQRAAPKETNPGSMAAARQVDSGIDDPFEQPEESGQNDRMWPDTDRSRGEGADGSTQIVAETVRETTLPSDGDDAQPRRNERSRSLQPGEADESTHQRRADAEPGQPAPSPPEAAALSDSSSSVEAAAPPAEPSAPATTSQTPPSPTDGGDDESRIESATPSPQQPAPVSTPTANETISRDVSPQDSQRREPSQKMMPPRVEQPPRVVETRDASTDESSGISIGTLTVEMAPQQQDKPKRRRAKSSSSSPKGLDFPFRHGVGLNWR